MGMVPAMMYHPSRASARCSGVSVRPEAFPRENTLKNQERMMLPMSRAKYRITANSVPIWVMAVNVAPGSVAPGKNKPAIRKCALDEMGRNSVKPWMSPKTIASTMRE